MVSRSGRGSEGTMGSVTAKESGSRAEAESEWQVRESGSRVGAVVAVEQPR